jgi:hypothetical protein
MIVKSIRVNCHTARVGAQSVFAIATPTIFSMDVIWFDRLLISRREQVQKEDHRYVTEP